MPGPEEPGTIFPHFGNLSDSDKLHLEGLGWKPRDVRAIADSSAIRLTFFAARLGMIDLSRGQMDALKEERMYWEQMAEVEARKDAAAKEKSINLLSLLEAFGSSGARVGVTPTPKARIGRPPGKKTPPGEPEPDA